MLEQYWVISEAWQPEWTPCSPAAAPPGPAAGAGEAADAADAAGAFPAAAAAAFIRRALCRKRMKSLSLCWGTGPSTRPWASFPLEACLP